MGLLVASPIILAIIVALVITTILPQRTLAQLYQQQVRAFVILAIAKTKVSSC